MNVRYEYFLMDTPHLGGNACYGVWGLVRSTKHCIAAAPVAGDPSWLAYAVSELNRRQTSFDLFAALILSGNLKDYIDS